MRRGVSLLEVLISVFVLSIGLLGLAALIPVGRFCIVETGKADRSAACGRAGLREIKIRGMLEPTTWFDYTATVASQVAPNAASALPFGESYCIDPLMIARNPNSQYTTIGRCPFCPDSSDPNAPANVPPPVLPRMTRVTLRDRATGNALGLPLADRIFTWHDDLKFETPEDGDLRPKAMLDGSNVQQIFGDYTWLVTVTPALVEAGLPVAKKQLYRVSVVVFFKRDFALPTKDDPVANERTVTANILGGGYGGGDVQLTVADPQFAQYLDLREDQWLMLCGEVTGQDSTGNPISYGGVFRWYRVIAAGAVEGDPSTGPMYRDVTLAGPDWDAAWCADLDGDGVASEVEAASFDGVLGVYTTLVELDGNLLWGK